MPIKKGAHNFYLLVYGLPFVAPFPSLFPVPMPFGQWKGKGKGDGVFLPFYGLSFLRKEPMKGAFPYRRYGMALIKKEAHKKGKPLRSRREKLCPNQKGIALGRV
jgi:hypothetical protein